MLSGKHAKCVCSCLIASMTNVQASLVQQEGMLVHGFEELSTGLLLTAASQALRLDNGQLMDQNCWASPDTFGKLDTLYALSLLS